MVIIDPGLRGKVVLITGSNSPQGIGAATARAFAARTPLRRVGQPDDVADAIVFLASHQARWIIGQVLRVGGSHTS